MRVGPTENSFADAAPENRNITPKIADFIIVFMVFDFYVIQCYNRKQFDIFKLQSDAGEVDFKSKLFISP